MLLSSPANAGGSPAEPPLLDLCWVPTNTDCHLIPGSTQGSVPALHKSVQGNFCSIIRAWLLSLESSPCLVHASSWFISLPGSSPCVPLPGSSSLLVHLPACPCPIHLPACPFELQHGPELLLHGEGSSSGKRRGCPAPPAGTA